MQVQRKQNATAPISAHKVANLADHTAAASAPGGVLVSFFATLADGVTATTTYTTPHKIEILDVIVQKRAGAGGASDTIQVKNGSDAISDAIDINVADKIIKRAGTIDDAFATIAAASAFSITKTKTSGANVACLVEVRARRLA